MKISMDVVRRCIEDIEEGGVVSAEALFEAARAADHPLHEEFEWDGDAAITKLGIDRAREIIRSVRVEITYEDRVLRSPVYVERPDKQHGEQGYLRVCDLAGTKARAVLDREIGAVEAALSRGLAVAAQLGLADDFNGLLLAVAGLREKVEVLPNKRKAPRAAMETAA